MFIINQDKNRSIDSYLIRTIEVKYYSDDNIYYIIAEVETGSKPVYPSNEISLGKYPTEQEAKNELINLSRVLSTKEYQDNLYMMG
jgi:hypothetical protein